jgi:hypothetical protein
MDLPDKTVGAPPPKKKVEQVVSGAKKVQRPASRRFFDYLFAESPKDLAKKIGSDVVVPRLKAGFEEAANNFLAGMLWGQNGNRPLSNIVQGAVLRGGTNIYNAASQPQSLAQARAANVSRTPGKYEDLVLPTQQAAETLLANLIDLHNQYRVVAVADLYEAAGITPGTSDNSYGWTSLDGARIIKDRQGFVLQLPRPTII